jgi:hypothetical protein
MNPMEVIVDGIRWVPFTVEFDADESVYSFHLYAVDWAHAMMRLDDLKATARIAGEVQGVIRA